MADYAAFELSQGERLSAIARHMLGLLTHRSGAKEYRRLLSEGARAAGAGPELFLRAAALCGAAPEVPSGTAPASPSATAAATSATIATGTA
jgi:tRNA-dihydrouridine synthase A